MSIKLVTRVNSIFDRIIEILVVFAGILLISMMVIVCLEVVLRYFFGRPTSWAVEISSIILLYIPFLVAAWVLRREGHVKMDLVLSHLDPKSQSLVNIITSIFIGAIICLLLTWYGVAVTWDHYQAGYVTATVLRLPKWPILAVIPVGSFLLFIQFLRRTYNYLTNRRALGSKEQGS